MVMPLFVKKKKQKENFNVHNVHLAVVLANISATQHEINVSNNK